MLSILYGTSHRVVFIHFCSFQGRAIEYVVAWTPTKSIGIYRGDNSAKTSTLFKMNQFEIEGCITMEHQPLLFLLLVHLSNRKHMSSFRFVFSVSMRRCTASAVAFSPVEFELHVIFFKQDILFTNFCFYTNLMNSHCMTDIIAEAKYQLPRMSAIIYGCG